MKRSKKSIVHIQGKSKRVAAEENDSNNDQQPSPSMGDLPTHLLIEILSRLSVKTIFICRCVSKTWLNLLSTPPFAKHHFTRAHTCPLLQNPSGKRLSRTLYLVELDRDSDLGDGSFGYSVNEKLDTKFNCPKLDEAKKMMPKCTRSLGLKLDIVNSCNGLLCLRGPSCDDPVVVYNPVAGDYITIPTPEKDNCMEKAVVSGLGFSPKTNRYKVLRMLYFRRPSVGQRLYVHMAETHTVGSGEWRRIGSCPFSLCRKSFPAFLNGALHWFRDDYHPDFIVSFNFGDERFQTIQPPPPYFLANDQFGPKQSSYRSYYSFKSEISMGVLKGSLYLCDSSSYGHFDIWVMKEYGVKESWFKEFKINTLLGRTWPAGLYQPIDFLENGDLLMYFKRNALISYDGVEFKYFKIRETESKFLAVAHIPSFVSLKDMVGNNVEVLNVRSR
ncbi:hypothetical protein L1049_023487 [Liquidambar formosana]|uniref:F-box domain-containing protein n=1 Tax=Liquidambar formosana TaxID=63359 RepID=A0AAP0RTF8_LIQFO